METDHFPAFDYVSFEFPAYLQGMETEGKEPSVPGRHRSQPTYKGWKLGGRWFVSPIWERSQPTYKGWKRPLRFWSFQAGTCVPSLPTRDGNGWQMATVLRCPPFPAYLQGMETTAPEAVSSTPAPVPSLPTRDGNHSVAGGIRRRFSGFPAYLQGMETVIHNYHISRI